MGVAMIWVLIFHFGCRIYTPVWRLNMGHVGVDIFFLSGLGFPSDSLGSTSGPRRL